MFRTKSNTSGRNVNQLVVIVLVEQVEVGRGPVVEARQDQVELLLGDGFLDQSRQQLRQLVLLDRSFQVGRSKQLENVDVPSDVKRMVIYKFH